MHEGDDAIRDRQSDPYPGLAPAQPEPSALLTAFNAVLSTVTPGRREAVLRRALVLLLSEADPGGGSARPLTEPRSPAISAGDTDAWFEVKARVRAELELRGASLAVLAEETGIPRSTLEKTLSPKGVIPGRLVCEKLAGWLDTSVNRPHNGAAPPEPEGTAIALYDGSDDHPLSAAQRERLAAYLALDSGEVLHQAGVSRAAAEAAVAGDADIDPKVVERLVRFLDEARATGP